MKMSARVGIVLSVVALGVAAALPFRKDAEPLAGSTKHNLSPIDRRIQPSNGESWKGAFPSSVLSTQPLRVPTAATGMDTRAEAETPDFPPSYHRTHSPVGALLNRPDEPLDDSIAAAEPMLLEPELSDPNARTITHKISDGDTLAALAKQYLQDASRWPELFEHNRDVLKSADMLPIGCVIKIPTRDQARPAMAPHVEPAGSMSPIPRGAFRRD
jgi:nucleoid-associated protein YgaU